MVNAKLVVVGGDAKMTEISLKLPTIIGRSREANLKLRHALVSRNHCELFERDGELFVRDLGSLNGTYVDSQRIAGDHALRRNQLLTIGTVTFRAVYGSEEASEPAVAPPQRPQRKKQAPPQPEFIEVEREKATDRSQFITETQYAPAAQSPPRPPQKAEPPIQEDAEVLREVAAHDTDPSLVGIDELALHDLAGSAPDAVISNVLIEGSGFHHNDSVSLSAIDQLPGAPENLSFVGGVVDPKHPDAGRPVAETSFPKIDTRSEKRSPPESKPRHPK